MQPFQRAKLLAGLSRKHRAFLEVTLPPFAALAIPSVSGPAYIRRYAAESSSREGGDTKATASLSVPSKARFNEINVQQLSHHVHTQVFRSPSSTPPPQELIDLSRDHLARHELLGKTSDHAPPIAFDVPALQGTTLDEHFHRLGMQASEPYLTLAKRYSYANTPPRPRKWVQRSGWTKYFADGTSEAVEAPDEEILTFDTEVMWKETNFACMACAASPTAWYAWISPWLLGESDTDRHLIPLGDPNKPRIIVGHNVGYDRARVREEYALEQSRNFYLDTMSLHVAVNGMCSRQRPTWMKHRKDRDLRDEIATKSDDGGTAAADIALLLDSRSLSDEEEDLWVGKSSINSLRDVARFHCGVTLDKEQREYFGELDRDGVVARLSELLDYCAADVDITHRVFRKVFPAFLETCPHPVSFAALRHIAAEILPVNKSWESYVANAEATYQKLSEGVTDRLVELARRALEVKEKPKEYETDPWLSQLDWSGQEIKMVKPKKKGEQPRPAAKQKLPGMPKWFKDLHATSTAPMNLTVRTRAAPLLLRLSWEGYPLVWSDVHGWTYKVPYSEGGKLHAKGLTEADMSDEENTKLRYDSSNLYFKLPHKDGPQARCANPLAKSYLAYFDRGVLSSEYDYAKEALEMNASCSYWISARDRIMGQMLVYADEAQPSESPKKRRTAKNSLGFILPQIIPMGTITRRAVENTWLTASNAKPNRVGSELKSMVTAPKGYVFVGADVDSQELWIASLIGDAQFRLHGGSAIGFMTLEGSKSLGTDLHSRTAGILGISRNDAKVFNYGRIYGAGQKFATQLLRQFNPTIREADALDTAARLYADTKGRKTSRKALHERAFWRGGTESLVFNRLEDFAEQARPRTPVLGAGITEALQRRNIARGGFLTSRINWAIQSSGVDYLHLLIVAMEHLIDLHGLRARLAITVHDEIRYLCREEDKYRVAMALQVANLWTRAIFAQQLGIEDLPQSCAFFSAVDVDHVLRKEVDMDCVTPSHPEAIPPGESLDIQALLAKGDEARLTIAKGTKDSLQALTKWEYEPREPVISALDTEPDTLYLRAQITSSDDELKAIVKAKQDQGKPIKPTTLLNALKPSSSGSKGGAGGGRKGRPRKIKGWTGKENAGLFDRGGVEAARGDFRREPKWLVPSAAEMEWERRYEPSFEEQGGVFR